MERPRHEIATETLQNFKAFAQTQTDIALLQETHLLETDFHRLKKWWVRRVEGSPAVGRKAGVVTLVRKIYHS